MSIYDALKDAGKLAQKSYKWLLSAREELAKIKDENSQLKEEIKSLKEKIEIKANVIFENGLCWLERDSLTKTEERTLLCAQCYQINDKIVRLSIKLKGNGGVFADCTNCKSYYVIKEGKPLNGFGIKPYGS